MACRLLLGRPERGWSRKLWATGLLLAAFAAGIGVGSVGGAALGLGRSWRADGGERHGDRDRSPGRSRQETSYLDRLERELTLRPEQRDSVKAILKRYDEPMREIWRRERQQVDSMRAQVRTEIVSLLDERQQEKFKLMNQRVDSLRALREREGAPRGR